jgi:hypothetical protein
MAQTSQEKANAIVERCKNAVLKYGGQSETLADVRKYYQMFHDCTEDGAYIFLDDALKKVGF